MKVVSIIMLSFLHNVLSQEALCRIEDFTFYQFVRSDHPTTTPFWQGKVVNDAAFAAFKTGGTFNPFNAVLSGSGDNQTIALYTTNRYRNFWNEWRNSIASYYIWLRCADSKTNGYILSVEEPGDNWYSATEWYPNEEPIYNLDIATAIETNSNPPVIPIYFSESTYTYSVAIPWPGSISITHKKSIWARDRDYYKSEYNIPEVTFSIDRPNIVTVTSTLYTDSDEARDFKIDLLLNPLVVPGRYEMVLRANDGTHVTSVPVTVIISEATCKAPNAKPVFGKVNANINFYQAHISSMPLSGDVLDLNGQQITAYHPDPLCKLHLSIEADFLTINEQGQIVFSQNLSVNEIHQLGSSYVTQIVATENVSGMVEKVPIFICLEIPEALPKQSALLSSNIN